MLMTGCMGLKLAGFFSTFSCEEATILRCFQTVFVWFPPQLLVAKKLGIFHSFQNVEHFLALKNAER